MGTSNRRLFSFFSISKGENKRYGSEIRKSLGVVTLKDARILRLGHFKVSRI